MSTRDRYDKDVLNALQSIARSLERIANAAEEKMEKNNEKTDNRNKIQKLLEDERGW